MAVGNCVAAGGGQLMVKEESEVCRLVHGFQNL